MWMGTPRKNEGKKQGREPKKSFHGNLLDHQLRRLAQMQRGASSRKPSPRQLVADRNRDFLRDAPKTTSIGRGEEDR
jgi:hypothetical protein